ncbi:asparagine synthase (glutamine-hydrolyzing) [Parachitinimonas caeni]|uniref:asparagine synthase (glutamine-hydrolyzing) n=1 Tax=Parachitinimonas caeni TaxID=3031301 RepID=A0ABT7DS35_9NEIS|nr:asparagine synthase (glutamine-hydrolyzing) [Parachitinimonas caeni]MDK2122886.1 asparagine synthase (glutamine-hydrolyzing) [Parachitinimonas caeni]
MCGISGLIAPQDRPLAPLLLAMTQAIAHRGPDDEGYALYGESGLGFRGGADTPEEVYHANLPYAPRQSLATPDQPARVALGHRRLSIVDLAPSGHQPMCTTDQRYSIVYNGEIYNHHELRQQLEALGHAFLSRSDTEVILAAYREWGVDCLHRFNGMFAFLLLDRERQTLFIARDRFGVKPLYYWRSADGLLAFASEIKQFTVLPGWTAKLNALRAYDFLNYGISDHCDETLFEDVRQLRGGEYIEATLDQLAHTLPIRPWYQLKPALVDHDFATAAHKFRDLLTDSVQLRLRADVPVGTGLSGGLDSSSIVCLANASLRQEGAEAMQNVFSACAQLKQYDEREYIDEVVRHTGVQAHQVFPELDPLLNQLDTITWHQDEPFGGTSLLAEWEVFRLVSSTPVKVTLDGHGSDELLAGYHSFFAPHYADLLLRGRFVELLKETRAAQNRHGYGARYTLQGLGNSLLPPALLQFLRRSTGRLPVEADWMETERLKVEHYDFFRHWQGSTHSISALSRAQLLRTSVPLQLHWADRDSMAHSIESRIPFLDYRLVEYILGCPDHYKLARGETKYLLREGLRGVLPEKIRTRQDKMGFVTPEAHWMCEQNPQRFLQAVDLAYEQARGVLNERALDKARRIIQRKEQFNRFAWRMISFGCWMNRFQVQVQ